MISGEGLEKQDSCENQTLECIDNLKEAIRIMEKIADAGIRTSEVPKRKKKG